MLKAKYTKDEDSGLAEETPLSNCFFKSLPSMKTSSTLTKPRISSEAYQLLLESSSFYG